MGCGGFLEFLEIPYRRTRERPTFEWAFLFPKAALGLLALGGFTACGLDNDSSIPLGTELAAPDRPNIIFLLTDDQRADSISANGHPFVHTPNIDQLARDGVLYTNAFTVEPICAPSRFAFFSGQYERTSGLGFNSPYQVSQRQWEQTYPALLRDAGYFTGFIGKFGVEYYALDGGASAQFDYWRAHDGWLPFFPKDLPDNPATHGYRGAKGNITTEIMGEYIQEFLGAVPADTPFNLSVSFSAPHNSVVSSMFPQAPYADCESRACELMGFPANENPRLVGHPFYDGLYRDMDVEISPDTSGDPYRFIPEGIIDHDARQHWYAYNYDRSTEPEHLIRYHQTITGIDQVVGDLLERLERLGLADNTVIIYSSDHGLLNGEYGTGGKGLLYDLVAKVPLIVYDPREADSNLNGDNSDLVLSIDVPATILSYAGVPVPVDMEGRDLNAKEPPRNEVFLESLTVAEGNPFIEALRTREWKYVRYLRPRGCPYTEEHLDFSGQEPLFEQFFNLVVDPGERNNLVGRREHAELLEEFRQRTRIRSAELTLSGRQYKQSMPVGPRPEERIYCW